MATPDQQGFRGANGLGQSVLLDLPLPRLAVDEDFHTIRPRRSIVSDKHVLPLIRLESLFRGDLDGVFGPGVDQVYGNRSITGEHVKAPVLGFIIHLGDQRTDLSLLRLDPAAVGELIGAIKISHLAKLNVRVPIQLQAPLVTRLDPLGVALNRAGTLVTGKVDDRATRTGGQRHVHHGKMEPIGCRLLGR